MAEKGITNEQAVEYLKQDKKVMDVVKIFIAAFKVSELKSHIRFTYDVDIEGKTEQYELTFLKIQNVKNYIK